MIIVASGHFSARFNGRHHLADPVDDGEHRADESPVWMAPFGTNVGKSILGSVTQRLEPREFEEAAIALHRVDKAKNAVESRAIVRLRLPGDDLAA